MTRPTAALLNAFDHQVRQLWAVRSASELIKSLCRRSVPKLNVVAYLHDHMCKLAISFEILDDASPVA
jgi:hypothetical protein